MAQTLFCLNMPLIVPVVHGFPVLRYNEIRDVTADLLNEICHNVSTKPDLQPLSGDPLRLKSANVQDVQDGASLDVKTCKTVLGRLTPMRIFCCTGFQPP